MITRRGAGTGAAPGAASRRSRARASAPGRLDRRRRGLLHITTAANDKYTITHRLHALESRLNPRRFVRLGRGTIGNVDLIARVSPMPGGTYIVIMSNSQELAVSRLRSRVLSETDVIRVRLRLYEDGAESARVTCIGIRWQIVSP